MTPRPRVTALAYHEIVSQPSRYVYHVPGELFRQQLALLRCFHQAHPDAHIAITFDDGHVSQATHAIDALAEHGILATFFVLAGPIGRSACGITWQELRRIADAGHSIASHGWSHRMLTLCSESELAQELDDSRAEIELHLGRPVTSFSAPGGRWDARVARRAAQTGYTHFFHSDPFARPVRLDGLTISGRLMMTRHMTDDAFLNAICPSFGRWAAGRLRGFAKQTLRSTMGDRSYHALWCRLAHYRAADGISLSVSSGAEEASR